MAYTIGGNHERRKRCPDRPHVAIRAQTQRHRKGCGSLNWPNQHSGKKPRTTDQARWPPNNWPIRHSRFGQAICVRGNRRADREKPQPKIADDRKIAQGIWRENQKQRIPKMSGLPPAFGNYPVFVHDPSFARRHHQLLQSTPTFLKPRNRDRLLVQQAVGLVDSLNPTYLNHDRLRARPFHRLR